MLPQEMMALLIIIVALLITIFYNLTLQKAMAAVREQNRAVAPGLIWLNFIPIPLLNSVWTMVFGILACNSINKDAGKKIAPSTLAVVYPSISIFTSILAVIMNASAGYRGPEEGFLLVVAIFSLATLILFIVFWAQINSAKNKLSNMSVRADSDSLDSGAVNAGGFTEKEKVQTLKEYKELLNEGVLTQEEFDKKKKELLS